MAGALPDKVLATIAGGKCALEMCLAAFDESGCIGRAVITFRDNAQKAEMEKIVARLNPGCAVVYAKGGKERQDSVLAALEVIPGDDGFVFIHDCARPLVTADDIRRLCTLAEKKGAASLAHPVTDTIKRVDPRDTDGTLTTVPRAELRAMETPQVFEIKTIRDAYRRVEKEGLAVTDDAAAAALLGVHPALLDPGHPNPKLTTPADVEWVSYILANGKSSSPMNATQPPFRTGFGYDIHRFAEGRKLILGGVIIPCEKGLDGHSDADCLCHAIADAILGAAGLPDIGHYYPPNRTETKGMNSLEIVRGAVTHAAEKGLHVGNIDTTLIARAPKIAPHIAAMKEKLSAALGIPADLIGIKATTNEGIDGLGKGEGIAAHAVALLYAEGR
jgi:2-C-methyl-D-erythritol 2,4-cyclodiphosphate synthase/2-C-methyl-D-erythritol 4-phosphate cytidylyltransferase